MMSYAGLLAAAWLSAAGSGPAAGGPIQTEVRIVEMKGLDWRSASQTKLDLVTTQGGATIWTCSREVAETILKGADLVIQAPKITSDAGSVGVIRTDKRRHFVAHVAPVAGSPPGQATAIGFKPEIRSLPDSMNCTISGRGLDQGALLNVAIDDCQVIAMHSVSCPEAIASKTTGGAATIRATCQVPEVANCHVAGEWLVPTDGALVISLGAHTVKSGPLGLATVRERLALIRCKGLTGPRPADTASRTVISKPGHSIALRFDPSVGKVVFADQGAVVGPPAPTPRVVLPALPSRALPAGTDAHGNAVMPAVPEDEAIEPVSEEELAETRPSPQGKKNAVEPTHRAEFAAAAPRLTGSVTITGKLSLGDEASSTVTADSIKLTKLPTTTRIEKTPVAASAADYEVDTTVAALGLPPISLSPLKVGNISVEVSLQFGKPNKLSLGLKLDPAKAALPARDPAVKPTSAKAPSCETECCQAGK